MKKKGTELTTTENKPEGPNVKKRYSVRAYKLAAAGILLLVGVIGLVAYAVTGNLMFGYLMVIFIAGGAVLGYHSWKSGTDSIAISTIKDDVTVQDESINCLNIYHDRIIFESYIPDGKNKPDGFPAECLNDHKHYYINLSPDNWNPEKSGLLPLVLPDSHSYDPVVFAERVLELPAHRRVMKRREKMAGVVKTALLVLSLIIIWILIVTTTGN